MFPKSTVAPLALWIAVALGVTAVVASAPDATPTGQAVVLGTAEVNHHGDIAPVSDMSALDSVVEVAPTSDPGTPAIVRGCEDTDEACAPADLPAESPTGSHDAHPTYVDPHDVPVMCGGSHDSEAPPADECEDAWMVPITPPYLLDPSNGENHHDPEAGPYINVDAIPTGDPGSSERRIRDSDVTPQEGGGSEGAFRTVCTYSHMNFDDAIVFPGQSGAAHLHTYFGNTAVTAYTTAESLLTSGNSTCRGGIVNRSAYWVPSMIDGDGTPLAPALSHFYYKTGYMDDPYDVSPFPAGLRILAGASMSDPTAEHRQTYFTCAGADPYASYDYIPDCPAGTEELGMHIQFPQCWVGYDDVGMPVLDSPDHRSHMAYPSGGVCPDTHPVRIPHITYNIMYPIEGASTDQWRLASDVYDADLPAGLSLHADWFAGWEDDVVEEFVSQCVQPRLDCQSHIVGPGRSIY